MAYDLRTIKSEAREEVRRREAEVKSLLDVWKNIQENTPQNAEAWRAWSDADNSLFDFVQDNLLKWNKRIPVIPEANPLQEVYFDPEAGFYQKTEEA